MSRLCGASFGLLLFSAMVVCGLLADNPVPQIVLRALLGLLGGFILGSLAGWIGVCVVRDNVPTFEGDENMPVEEAGEVEAS